MSKNGQSEDLFRSRLEQILNLKYPLCVLAERINWSAFEHEFGALYCENIGRPGLPIRLLVGLRYLKHAYGESDELVVEPALAGWRILIGNISVAMSISSPPLAGFLWIRLHW